MEKRKLNTYMKFLIGVISLIHTTASWGQEPSIQPSDGNNVISVATQIPLENSAKGSVSIELDVNSGEKFDEAWLDRKVQLAKSNGFQVQYVVLGEKTGAKNL